MAISLSKTHWGATKKNLYHQQDLAYFFNAAYDCEKCIEICNSMTYFICTAGEIQGEETGCI
jgi:hypothetical protein